MIKFKHIKSFKSKRIVTFCYSLVDCINNKTALKYQFIIFNPSKNYPSWDRKIGISLTYHRFVEKPYYIDISDLSGFHSSDLFVYLMISDVLNHFHEIISDIETEKNIHVSYPLEKELYKIFQEFQIVYRERSKNKLIERVDEYYLKTMFL